MQESVTCIQRTYLDFHCHLFKCYRIDNRITAPWCRTPFLGKKSCTKRRCAEWSSI